MARVVSTTAAYRELAERTPGGCSEALWLASYEARHDAVFDSYYSSWGDAGARGVAAALMRSLAPDIPHREGRARALVDRAEGRMRAQGLLDDRDVAAVLLVGVGSSNGWVTQWLGAPTVFLALEMLPDPPFDEVLVVHEMTHLAHERRRPTPWPETVGTRLFAEGLAGLVSRCLVPELALDAYLWFDGLHAGWLRDCEHQGAELVAALLRDSELPENAGHRFFSAQSGLARGRPVRSGYWVGMQAVQWLVAGPAQEPLARLLSWDSRTATQRLARALTSIGA